MSFKKSYKKTKGYTQICKIGECSLKKLEFGIISLDSGESVDYNTEDKETAFIIPVNVETPIQKRRRRWDIMWWITRVQDVIM